MTDTSRSATEMLLISQAVDMAVAQIDFSPLAGQTVFLDAAPVEKEIVDKGYLVSLVRQQLLAHGALLQEDKSRAVYVVELRSGGLGTDRHSLLVGTPAVSLPSIVPGVPGANVPEIALMKRSDQRAVAKIGVFAYNRITGRAVWQSGTVEADSRSNDTWVIGAGPFNWGTIRKRTELAGQELPTIPLPTFNPLGEKDQPQQPEAVGHPPGQWAVYPGSAVPPPPLPLPAGLTGVVGPAAVTDRPVVR
jgi:hypothetical protein